MLDEDSQRRKLKTHVQTNWRRHYIKLLIGPCKICFWVTGELDLSSKTLEYQLNWMLQKKWEKSRGFLLNSPLGLSGTNPLSIQRWSSRTHVPGDPFLENKLHRVVTYHFVILRSWEAQKCKFEKNINPSWEVSDPRFLGHKIKSYPILMILVPNNTHGTLNLPTKY